MFSTVSATMMTAILREKHSQTYFANYFAKPLKIMLGAVLIFFLFLLKS